MRILSITAGAAGMYCGSCLRDNGLAAELRARGHDVTLLPIYTPTRTDEENVSEGRVFFGGVSVYLQQRMPLFRKTPWVLDRLWDSTVVLRTLARRSIRTDPRDLGEMTVSMLKGENGFQRKELQKLLRWLRGEPPPDVVNLPNSLLIALAAPIKRALGVPVCCTLQGEDLFLDGLREPYHSEARDLIRSNLEHVDCFVAVSDSYARFMIDYLGISPDRMRVVPIGINLTGYDIGARETAAVFTIGYFARIAPEKGLHLLCDAYRRLRREQGLASSRLEVAGYLGADHEAYFARVTSQMQEWGLAGEFHYWGEVDREGKLAFLRRLDVLSVPSTHDEPKGIYVLEALASGVPVVQPRRGVFPEILERTGGGVLVDPDDPDRLAAALLGIWNDPMGAAELGRQGAAGVREHYSVARMADRALDVYRALTV